MFWLPAIPLDETGESTRIVRTGTFVMVLFLGGFLVWAGFAPIHGAVIAEGTVKVDFNRKSVQHLGGGVIRDILVREGSHVEAGQPLVILDDTSASANLNILRDQLDAHRAKEARLNAEKLLSAKVHYPSDWEARHSDKLDEVIRKENALFEARRKTLNDSIALIRAQIGQAQEAIAGYQKQIGAIEDGIQYSEEQLKASEALLAKNYLDKTQYWDLKRQQAEKKERLGAQAAELSKTRQLVASLELQLIQARNAYTEQASNELKEALNAINEVQEKLRPAEQDLSRQVITAPIAGQVINIKVFTQGGVVKPGDTLMDVVPVTDTLILEAKIKPQDVESVFVDQSAEVQLSAYNQSTTPMLPGKVFYVSGDAILDEGSNPPQFFYRTHVRVDPGALEPYKEITLSPGMPVVVYLQTKSRTFLEYMSSPILDRMRHALRES